MNFALPPHGEAGAGGVHRGDIRDHLGPRRTAVEAALREWHARLTADCPPALADAIGYSLFAPGKRLRPLLAVLACEAVGGAIESALPAACAAEMVHTYSLVHDDLPAMDDDDLRRGLPTCHVKYGEALAILAGDALLTMAFEVLASGYAPRTAAVTCAELARGAGAAGMVGGQVLDLTADGKIAMPPSGSNSTSPLVGEVGDSVGVAGRGVAGTETPLPVLAPLEPTSPSRGEVGDEAALEGIHRRKTGALFRSSLRLGQAAAQAERPEGVDPRAKALLDRYAEAFGLAFQVTDDLLDVEGSAEAAGKRVNKDATRGKLTYPGLLGTAASRAKAAALGRAAVEAAEELGPGGAPLAALARYVVERDR